MPQTSSDAHRKELWQSFKKDVFYYAYFEIPSGQWQDRKSEKVGTFITAWRIATSLTFTVKLQHTWTNRGIEQKVTVVNTGQGSWIFKIISNSDLPIIRTVHAHSICY